MSNVNVSVNVIGQSSNDEAIARAYAVAVRFFGELAAEASFVSACPSTGQEANRVLDRLFREAIVTLDGAVKIAAESVEALRGPSKYNSFLRMTLAQYDQGLTKAKEAIRPSEVLLGFRQAADATLRLLRSPIARQIRETGTGPAPRKAKMPPRPVPAKLVYVPARSSKAERRAVAATARSFALSHM